jgi:GAF domain-containing protein
MSDRCTLRSLLENLGADIVQVVAAPAGLDVAVGHPVIDDPADPPPVESGDVLLAVGTPATSSAAPGVVERAGRGGASAVVFRHVDSNPAALAAASASSSVAVLVTVPAMAWSQLHTLMRTAVAASGSSSPEGEAAGAIGDLFGLANAIAAMVGGPTTIEDPQSTVLAYSSLDNPIDDARRQTILGRRVPEEWMQRLHDDGVFRRLWSRDEVVCIDYPGEQPELRRRLAVAVRAGGEVLGSIWVAEDERPLDANAEGALREASRIAALHLLRARAGEDLQWARRSNLLRAMLDGHAVGRLLAASLDADETEHVTVVGFRLPPESMPDLAVQGRRACRLLDMYCESTRRRGSSVAVGQVVYLLLVDPTPPAVERLEALASEVAGKEGQMLPAGTIAGIGSTYAGFSCVPASRIEADRVLTVLATLAPGRSVGTIHGVRGHAILLRLKELVASEPDLLKGHIEILEAHDAGGRGQYIQTLRAYLDAFGDVPTAAAALDVHPNTFRYRMRRLTEVSGLILDDPVERLVAHMQLHLGE